MTFLFYGVLVLHIVACLFLIGVVLLQQGKGQDLASAFGGGVTQTAFGPRGSANVLSRATTILAGLFMVTSVGLSVIRPASFLEELPGGAPAATTTARPRPGDAPAAGEPAARPGEATAPESK